MNSLHTLTELSWPQLIVISRYSRNWCPRSTLPLASCCSLVETLGATVVWRLFTIPPPPLNVVRAWLSPTLFTCNSPAGAPLTCFADGTSQWICLWWSPNTLLPISPCVEYRMLSMVAIYVWLSMCLNHWWYYIYVLVK